LNKKHIFAYMIEQKNIYNSVVAGYININEIIEENILLKEKIRLIENKNGLLENNNSLLEKKLSKAESEIAYLKSEIKNLKKLVFGAKSERFISNNNVDQQKLQFEGAEIASSETIIEEVVQVIEQHERIVTPKVIKSPSRNALPEHLPRIKEVIEPKEIEEGAKKIGEEITEILEYTPGKIYVRQIIRPKYTVPSTGSITISRLPSLPIPKGNAGSSLISHIIVSKLVDHLPFYRQSKIFKREGVDIAESTINDWFKIACENIKPVYEKLFSEITNTDYLMADETPLAVLSQDKPNATHQGYFWLYYNPKDKLICVVYCKGRGREGPSEFLNSYIGALQTDGYKVYDSFEGKNGIVLLSCMAHARRKFTEALSNDKKRAEIALEYFQKLYHIEKIAREGTYTSEERKALRQKESVPVLEEFKTWLIENNNVLPRSAIGVAINYTLKLWHRLERYADNGNYEIDNNLIENSIRPIALGKKNYLFAGSHNGAKRLAIAYSLLLTCKINQVNPYEYLKDILTRAQDINHKNIKELLPNYWTQTM